MYKVALEKLTHDLPLEKMKHVVSFNHTYLVITRNVRVLARHEAFEHPEFLTRFDKVFADYYFSALKGFLNNDVIPEAWKIAFDLEESGRVSSFIAMALGVNAHVNNDIAQALLDSKAQKMHYKDYLKVNDIIIDSIKEVIDSLPGNTKFYGPKNTLLRPMYKLLMGFLIKRWRRKAWKKYLSLKSDSHYVRTIERDAAFKARLLAHLPI